MENVIVPNLRKVLALKDWCGCIVNRRLMQEDEMEWFVVVSCIASHVWGGWLYCGSFKDVEVSYGQTSEAQCTKWAEDYLTDKYHLHSGNFEWGYRCVQHVPPLPYKPTKLGTNG
jgi:hypothetical protein